MSVYLRNMKIKGIFTLESGGPLFYPPPKKKNAHQESKSPNQLDNFFLLFFLSFASGGFFKAA